VDFTTTQARDKGAAPSINHEGGQQPTLARASQVMAVAAVPLNRLPSPSTDRWTGCIAIAVAQLVDCAR
jgi:hypothetical protein